MADYFLQDENGEPLLLRGVAVPYNERILVNDVSERFQCGAFQQQHRDAFANCVLQWDHGDDQQSISSVNDNTLAFFDTQFGLMFESLLPADPVAQGIARMARTGSLGCSIEFNPDAERSADGTVTKARLGHLALYTAGMTCYDTICWIENSTNRYPTRGLTAEALKWRQHLEAHLRYAAA